MKKQMKMKKLHKINWILLLFVVIAGSAYAQEEKPSLSVDVHYYNQNNSLQWLMVNARVKADNKLQAVKDVMLEVYLDSVSKENLAGKGKTNEVGAAKFVFPASLKDKWLSGTKHKFLVVAQAVKGIEGTTAELEIEKARIILDTVDADGTRTVSVMVQSLEGDTWVPARDVELKIGVQRLGGQLKIGDDESYTTDSTGMIQAEFKLDSLPAIDIKGNVELVAKTEDNELFGNLSVEKTVPWGHYYQRENNFGQRSLWATRFRTPLWLLFMAYSIMAAVWGVIIYLVVQIVKIKKLGKEEGNNAERESKKAESSLPAGLLQS